MVEDKTPFFVTLQDRGLIEIEGPDARAFLQALISNDVDKTAPGALTYACLLTPQGKFLHDFFIHDADDALLLDCEGGERAQDLYTRLTKYRLRADVRISVEETHPVYTVFGAGDGLPDPRHADMGRRAFEKPSLPEQDFTVWDEQRITLGIPDGSRDMVVGSSTLLECNLDRFHAIDWDKGCYVGQELTARMHYRGLAKKHLHPITGATLPAAFTDLEDNGTLIGEMRSSCGNIGLALLKDDALERLNEQSPIHLLG